MKKNEKQIAVIAVIAIVVLAWFGGFLTQFGFPPPTLQTGTREVIVTEGQRDDYEKGVGRWTLYETTACTLDPGTTYTHDTEFQLLWYTRHGSEWIYQEAGGGADKFAELTPADGGYLWAVVKIKSSQNYYVDYQKIVTVNDWVDSYQYVDVDDDGVREFCFKYDMKGHSIPDSGYPGITFLGFLLPYDSSFTGINDLGNITGIGEATNSSVFQDYYLKFSATKKALAIYKAEVKITTTDETKVRLKHLNIPGLGYLDGSAFDKTLTASDIRYTYTISKTFDGALYLKHSTNAQNRYECTLQLECTLANADDLLVTVTFFYLVAQTEAGGSTNDTFYAQEA